MPLRSSAPTIGAMVGNDMLDRADALVVELRIRPRLREDARQTAVLALLEGQDPERAIARFVDDERACGMTGGGTRPTVLRLTEDELARAGAVAVSAEDQLIERERNEERAEIAGAVLVGLSRRDRKIVRLTAQGWTQAEIAAHLGMSQQAIAKILAKIQTKSKTLLRRGCDGG